ncbi:cupin domain-containing protein [Rhodobacteraceae bacterium MCCB 386]|nr:cupin domain-containing protein [Roseitranquillus sediminis]
MGTIRHHLTDETLLAYSAGTLPEAFALVAASHLSLCDECRARLGAFEAVGGATLTSVGTAEMGDASLERTLAMIRGTPGDPDPAPRRSAGTLPIPLSDYVGGDVDAIRWRPVGGGVRQMVLKTGDEATARLLYIPAGEAVPEHTHGGMELTMVLSGAFSDEVDRFGPGDVETADPTIQHQPIAEPGAPCICLAATDSRLRFRSWIPRLLGPIIGI